MKREARSPVKRNQEAGGAILREPNQTHVTHKFHKNLHPKVPDTRASGAQGGGVRRRTRSAERQTTRKLDSLHRRGCTRKERDYIT